MTNKQSLILSTDMIQPTLTLKMTTAQVVETSVAVSCHLDNHVPPTNEMTARFKPFTIMGRFSIAFTACV